MVATTGTIALLIKGMFASAGVNVCLRVKVGVKTAGIYVNFCLFVFVSVENYYHREKSCLSATKCALSPFSGVNL